MKKVALVFVLAVFGPSLVLAWLAVRSLHDQQFVLERQRALLYQSVADSIVKDIAGFLAERQREFAGHVESYINPGTATNSGADFDAYLRRQWPLAEIGFGVSFQQGLLFPAPASSPAARMFCADNAAFLANREVAEVYWNTLNGNVAVQNQAAGRNTSTFNNYASASGSNSDANLYLGKLQNRKVIPAEQQADAAAPPPPLAGPGQQVFVAQPLSKVAPADAEFRQLIGDGTDGMLARFVQNKLRLLFWHRQQPTSEPIFGAQVDLPRLVRELHHLIRVEPELAGEICLGLLDDNARPLTRTDPGFETEWKHPFVAAEIGEALPHWEVAVYLRNPARLGEIVRTTRLTLGLLIGVLVSAIAVGSWLIVRDLNRHLTLARQKTDFVSNVSHELKTPLTSIRMFSELLADGRVLAPEKQRSYLHIITTETARLTRLINNVLDFARLERGEQNYRRTPCNLAALVSETAATFRPQLESAGFVFSVALPETPITVSADRDALAQVIVNLLSNAEKYSPGAKEIRLTLHAVGPAAELQVLDRGPGVPRGCEERIFEKFFRANDSLTNAIPGSGLGLTLARQIARAHGGELTYAPRAGGGSCFTLRLPLSPSAA